MLIDLNVPENISELLKNSSVTPDFQILTDGMVSDAHRKNLVHMVGSSTERDLEGDTMSIHALNDMTKAPKNLTVWLNHDYTLPDSIFGSIVGTPTIMHQDGIADLHLSVDVEMDNPAAAKVKQYIDNGRRLGCSIGCMVTKFEVPDDEDGLEWFQNPIIIHGVKVVEYSVVGVPANQRSWVENAIRGVFTRTLHPKLVPAMKSLWPRVYKDILETKVKGDVEYFEKQPERLTQGKRLNWEPGKNVFVLSSKKGQEQVMGKDELKQYIAGNAVMGDSRTANQVFIDSSSSTTATIPPVIVTTYTASNTVPNQTLAVNTTASKSTTIEASTLDEVNSVSHTVIPEMVRTACGSTSLELDMNSSWDKGEAHKRILEWAGGKDGFSKSKMKQVHFRVDGDGSNVTDYHLPFADIKSGHPVAIWHAIVAVTGALGGSRSGLTNEGDEAAIRAKVAHYYHKAGKPVPWENNDKSAENVVETHEHNHEQNMNKTVGFAINKDGAPGVTIDANGNHEIVSGTHTHFHHSSTNKSVTTPGAIEPVGGQLHIHEHSHDNDNIHEHVHPDHDTDAGFKPPVSIQPADPDRDGDIDTTPHSDADLDRYGGQRQLAADEEHLKAQLEAYNGFAKLLGLPELAYDMYKKEKGVYPTTPAMDTPPTPLTGEGLPDHVRKAMRVIHARTYAMTGGKVCSGFGSNGEDLTKATQAPDGSYPTPLHPHHAAHVQGIHDKAHAMSGQDGDGDVDDLKRALTVDIVKELMDNYGPGSGGGAPGPAGLPPHIQKAIQGIHAHTYSMTGGKVCSGIGSDGSHLVSPAMAPNGSHPTPLHPDHAAHVQKAHDVIHALTGGMACGMGSAHETTYQEARQNLMDAEGQEIPDNGAPTLRSFESTKDLAIIKEFRGEMDALKKEFAIAKKGIQEIYSEAAQAAKTVAALKNMPLGNPIKQERNVVSTEHATTHAELLAVGANTDTLEGILAMTTIETIKARGMTIAYRKWANGLGGVVGKGVRPELTSNQIALMSFDDIEAYRAGFAAFVPMVDDPAEGL